MDFHGQISFFCYDEVYTVNGVTEKMRHLIKDCSKLTCDL